MKMKKRKMVLIVVAVLVVLLAVTMMIPGRTAPIVDEAGKPIPGSIAVMEKVKLGGVDQWVVIRGKSVENPVLLLLSGGPGGSEMGRFLRFNAALEDHFIVVNWEQRGCGKSYPAYKAKEGLTVDRYVEDIYELTQMLKTRFNKEKIYLLGHSWGTIIGVKAVQKYPKEFYAYIGSAQMVNIVETDRYIYRYVMDMAKQYGDTKLVKKMEKLGEPPYSGKGMLQKYSSFLGRYETYKRKETNYLQNEDYRKNESMAMFFFREYGTVDKIRAVRGLIDTFQAMYPQIQDLNFVEQAPQLEVPVYFLIGRHDYTGQFVEEYYEALTAPKKELIWFENSAHGNIWSEADQFHQIMLEKVLPETLSSAQDGKLES